MNLGLRECNELRRPIGKPMAWSNPIPVKPIYHNIASAYPLGKNPTPPQLLGDVDLQTWKESILFFPHTRWCWGRHCCITITPEQGRSMVTITPVWSRYVCMVWQAGGRIGKAVFSPLTERIKKKATHHAERSHVVRSGQNYYIRPSSYTAEIARADTHLGSFRALQRAARLWIDQSRFCIFFRQTGPAHGHRPRRLLNRTNSCVCPTNQFFLRSTSPSLVLVDPWPNPACSSCSGNSSSLVN